MRTFSRAALAVASFFCLLGTATVAAPSFAAEGSAPRGTATAMLAAVTAPLLAVDVRSLEARNSDFSTSADVPVAPAQADDGDDQAAAAEPQSLDDLVAQHVADTTGDKQAIALRPRSISRRRASR